MTDEPQYESIHEKLSQKMKKTADSMFGSNTSMKTYQEPAQPDMVQIMQALQYILDKLHGIDRFLRCEYKPVRNSTYDAEKHGENAESLREHRAAMELAAQKYFEGK